jgi:curli biogenesis system outer membrane secretion channel CsgG
MKMLSINQLKKILLEKGLLFIGSLVVLVTVWGCATSSRVYLNPRTDLGYIKRIVVLPFDNLTGEKYVGEKISQSFIAELLIAGDFEVVELGEVAKVIQTNSATGVMLLGPDGTMHPDIAKLEKLTSQLNCQAVVIGTVTSYEMVRVGSEQYPQISINIRLVDGKTATIIWMSTFTKRGGPGFPFIGFGEKYTLSELTQDICKDIVSAISKKVKKL